MEEKAPIVAMAVVSDQIATATVVNADCHVVPLSTVPSPPPLANAPMGECSSFDEIITEPTTTHQQQYRGIHAATTDVAVFPSNTIQVARQVSQSDDENEHDVVLSRRGSSMKTKGKGGCNCSTSEERWYGFSSSHVLMNCEREKRGLERLVRRRDLDEAARTKVEAMAAKGSAKSSNHNKKKKNPFRKINKAFHPKNKNTGAAAYTDHGEDHDSASLSSTDLRKQLGISPKARIGENVAKGSSILEIHQHMMEKSSKNRRNMLDDKYRQVGMATAKGKSGKTLYLCQIFIE